MLDISDCKQITDLVEKLSTSGKEVVDKTLFRELAALSGRSNEYLKFTLEKLFHQLERKHSEIRFGAFLVIDLLFRKSECFRELLLDEFHVFLELTVESNSTKLLPPPIPAAKKLKQRVLQCIHKWYSSFQHNHKRLALSYNFLKHNLKVDFDDALKRNAFELQQDLATREKQSKIVSKKVDGVRSEMEVKIEEISRTISEINNCFCLLVPKPNDLFGDLEGNPELQREANDDNKIDLREHGIIDRRTLIPIQLSTQPQQVKVTEDNFPIVQNLKDQYSELKNGYLPLIKKWAQITSKGDDTTLFRKVMDVKGLVEEEMKRFEDLKLVEHTASESDSESDSDFEDVPDKEGFEELVVQPPHVVQPSDSHLATPNASSSFVSKWRPWNETDDDANDPTTRIATIVKMRSKQVSATVTSDTADNVNNSNSSSSNLRETPGHSKLLNDTPETRKARLLKSAPKLPYDVDLYHWEDADDKLTAPSVEIVETDGHKFWTPSQDRAGEVIEDPNGIATLRTRVIEFTGKFEAVKWSCRTPLPSGRLCPRMDRLKCPLHGKIIARDEMGNPVKPEDIAELEAEKEKAERDKPPDWQDPEFLKDIEAQTGMDLTIRPSKRGKKKQSFKETYPGLTDLRKTNPRARLEKKVFNKGAVKRVATTLDSLTYKRSRDKFADQWNYSMNND